jgi:hypothetical protein
MWDLWWDKVALGQVFSEFFGFTCNRRSLHQLLHSHPHVSSGECTIGQCGRSAGTYRELGALKQRDLRNMNLGDLKKGTNGGLSPTPQKKNRTTQTQNKHIHIPNIHALFGIRTHVPGFRANEDSSCLRPLGYRNRPLAEIPYHRREKCLIS